MNMRYEAILFDLDGTLLDTLSDLTDSVNTALHAMGRPARELNEVRGFVGDGVRALAGRALSTQVVPEIDRFLGLFKEHYDRNMQNKTAPYPGIMEMLRSLRAANIACAVVSNKYDDAVRALCTQYFGDLIQVAVGEGNGIPKKPAPDGARRAIDLLDARAKRTLYVGDSDVDVLTAHNAGLICAGVTWGFRPRETLATAGADAIVDSPGELLALILNEKQPPRP